jgi:hypothetical protein
MTQIGRKIGIICNAVIFLVGSSLQAGATSPSKFCFATPLSLAEDLLVGLFTGSTATGLATGSLTHVVPMYIAEISSAKIRGSLVSLQQLAITFGVSETTRTEVMRLTSRNVDSCQLCVAACFHKFKCTHYSKTGSRMARHILGEPDAPRKYRTLGRFRMAYLCSILTQMSLVAVALVRHKRHGEFHLHSKYYLPWCVDYIFCLPLIPMKV